MKRTVYHLLIVGAVVAAYLLGAFAPLERSLASLHFRLMQTDASGDIVVVGIDSRSLRELDVWPWPREYHAALIDRLVASGARRIAFDIDFSSRSNDTSDSQFEAALARAGDRMIMATFKQPGQDEHGNEVWVYTAPIPRLAAHGNFGHVNVEVEEDSLVWRYTMFEDIDDIRIAGMATLMAHAEYETPRSILIDYAIRPETLPYVSYYDVLNNRFDPTVFAGKTVIVGATALELGDRIPVPVHQVLPGPVVQALIAETIYQGRGLSRLDPRIVTLLAILVGAIFAGFMARWSWKIGAIAVIALGGGLFGVSMAVHHLAGTLIEISPVFLAPLAIFILNLTRSIDLLTGAFRQERFESRYRRAMMDAVVESGFDGIAIADRNGEIELVNPSAAAIVGQSEEQLVGQAIQNVLPGASAVESQFGRDDDGRHTSNTVGPIELPLSRGEETLTVELIVGSARLALHGAKDSETDERVVYIYTFRDISDRKRVEEAQKAAVEEAEASNRAKTEFLHNMSHELRTPLNAIIGFSDIMKAEMMGPIGAKQYKTYVGDINDSGQHLLSVVNDILDMSKIESGQMELIESDVSPFDIIETSRRMIEERAWIAKLKLVTDAAEEIPEIVADDRMVKQMLLNLLSNAVKFTPKGGTVTAGARVEPDGGVTFWVTDTGIGIDNAQFDRILEPFGQADASLGREYEGTGLGLPLVKSMVELHGGALHIESAPGEGSTFSLAFPAERTLTESREEEPPKAVTA